MCNVEPSVKGIKRGRQKMLKVVHYIHIYFERVTLLLKSCLPYSDLREGQILPARTLNFHNVFN